MSKITKLSIDTSLMTNSETTRDFTINGDIGAKFTVVALQDGTLKYYNFEDEIFELGHAPKSNLTVVMTSSIYKSRIVFPSGGGTYIIKLISHFGSNLKDGSSTSSQTIEKQSSEATITFTPATTNTANYQTFPTTTSVGSVSDAAKLESSWTINNASDDTGGFGLKFHDDIGGSKFEGNIAADIFDSFWYTQSTKAIADNPAGDGEDSTKITVANTTGLSIGMLLIYHKGTTVPVTKAAGTVTNCVIVGLDTEAGEIKFNTEVAFEDGETMTLRAYGSKNIYYNIGAIVEFGNALIKAPLLTKTLRTDCAATQTITLTDTHGISGGNTVSYIGVGVNNVSNNRVNVVTPDCPDLGSSGALDNDGQMTVELAQTLSQGSVLTFLDIYNQVAIHFIKKISQYPETSKSINLDLDKILAVGVSGS